MRILEPKSRTLSLYMSPKVSLEANWDFEPWSRKDQLIKKLSTEGVYLIDIKLVKPNEDSSYGYPYQGLVTRRDEESL